jgi:hypothetical protein
MCRVASRKTVSLFLLAMGFVLVLSGFAAAATIYSQGFEDATPPYLPAGCSYEQVSGTIGAWATATGTVQPPGQLPHSGNNLAYFNSYSAPSGSSARLRLGTLNLGAYGNVTFRVWMYHDTAWSNNTDNIQVQVSIDGGTVWEDVGDPIWRCDGTAGWAEATIDLSLYGGEEEVLLGILGNGLYGNDVHIDDISVEGEAPPIRKAVTPSPEDGSLDVTVDPTLSWVHSGDVSFDVYFGIESNDLPLIAGGLSGMSYAVSDLANETTYYWRVDVRSGDLGVSGDVWSFTTEADVFKNYDSWGSGGCNAAELGLIGLALFAPLGLLRRKSS